MWNAYAGTTKWKVPWIDGDLTTAGILVELEGFNETGQIC